MTSQSCHAKTIFVGKLYIHFLVIVALISASISPACAFMNGQWMEICNDTQVTMTFIPAKPGSDAPSVPTKNKDDCAFCFQFAHGSGMQPDLTSLISIDLIQTYGDGFYRQSALSQFTKTRKSRAPPIFS